MGVPPQRKSWLCHVSYHRSSEHCILMDMLTTRKEAKSLPYQTFPGLKKTIKIAFAAGALPRTPLGSLQRSPDPVVAFKGRFAAGRGKGRQKGRGREEKGGREGEGSPQSALDLPVGGELAPSLLGGIDAPGCRSIKRSCDLSVCPFVCLSHAIDRHIVTTEY